ncbi:MAG: Ig-like domain-containing protein [Rubrivivax sp.]
MELAFSVTGFGTVSTPAGSFADAATGPPRSDEREGHSRGGTVVIRTVTDEWYAKGSAQYGALDRADERHRPGRPDADPVDRGLRRRHSAPSETVAPTLVSIPRRPMAAPLPIARPRSCCASAKASRPQHLRRARRHPARGSGAGQPVATSRTVEGIGSGLTRDALSPLADGRCSVRVGRSVVDWANNAPVSVAPAFAVDTATAPGLVSSLPARGSEDFGFTGTVSLTFSEDVFVPGEGNPFIEITDASGVSVVQRLLPAGEWIHGERHGGAAATDRNTPYEFAAARRSRTARNPSPTWPRCRSAPTPGFALAPGAAGGRRGHLRRAAGRRRRRRPARHRVRGHRPRQRRCPLARRPGLAGGGFGPPVVLQSLADALVCDARELVVADFDGDGRADVA